MREAREHFTLLVKGSLDEPRLDLLRAGLETPWEIVAWHPRDGEPALARSLAHADAYLSMSWSRNMPAAMW